MRKAIALAALGLVGGTRAVEFTNPIKASAGADPFIVWDHPSSAYYFMTTMANQLQVSTATTIEGLRVDPKRKTVYQNQTMIDHPTVWAPELHNLGGSWYIYYAHDARPYVVKGGATPLDTYSDPVQLYDGYGVDGTVLIVNDNNYFVWSCRRNLASKDQVVQSICIAWMSSPTKLDTSVIGILSQPDQPWELSGINEQVSNIPARGPQPLYWKDDIFLTYSACFCGSPNYSLGLLNFLGGDPLDASNWKKHTAGPVLSSGNGEYGTGHNGIFKSPDGTEIWNAYHAVRNPSGACDQTRATFVEKVDMSEVDTQGPRFGQPAAYNSTFPGPSGEQGDTTTSRVSTVTSSSAGPASSTKVAATSTKQSETSSSHADLADKTQDLIVSSQSATPTAVPHCRRRSREQQ